MTKLSQMMLEPEWLKALSAEFESIGIHKLECYLNEQKAAGKLVYPAQELIFSAFNYTPLSQVRVVILGQDPYHGEGQAHGLSFSVPEGQAVPPSLRNMYKELHSDLACEVPNHGNLQQWAQQGVFLLNSVLTVEHALAGSHQKQGWEDFTDKVITLINERRQAVVFMLWGSHAHKKGRFIDESKHLVLKSPHPSPLSSYRGFFGCKHFSQANQYLLSNSQMVIDWQIR